MGKEKVKIPETMVIGNEQLKSLYTKLGEKQRYLKVNAAYAYGKNYKINADEDKPLPDNRISVPLGKSAVTDIVGYAGRPGEISTDYKVTNSAGVQESDNVTALIKLFDEHNQEGIENSELLTTSLSVGIAWELWYVSNELELSDGMFTPEYKIVKNTECIPIYDHGIKPKLLAFVRFQDLGDKQTADVYYPLKSEHWTMSKERNNNDWRRVEDGDTTYPYERVPAIPFRTSMNDEPVFEAQKGLMDALDSLVSKTQNEVDRFNALIALFPGTVDQEFLEKLTNLAKAYIEDLGEWDPEQWPKYLEKNFAGVNEFYTAQADRLERYFHKTIKIPDMSDENFAGNASGVAIAYKLIGFEFLISEIEVYFRQGLEARYKMYQDIIDTSTLSPEPVWENYTQTIIWNRNLPVDDEVKVRIAAMLQGLGFDMNIILKYLPKSIIESMTEEEIDAMLSAERVQDEF